MDETIATETPPRWVITVELTALPAWLGLARPQRGALVRDQVEPLLRGAPGVRVRWVDVEAFTGFCSDLLIAETDDLRAWNRLFEALRDTPLFAVPYFRLEQILTGMEDGYVEYERSLQGASGSTPAQVPVEA